MPAAFISVGLVVNPAMAGSFASAGMLARVAPSAKIFTRSRATLGVAACAAGSGAVVVISLYLVAAWSHARRDGLYSVSAWTTAADERASLVLLNERLRCYRPSIRSGRSPAGHRDVSR